MSNIYPAYGVTQPGLNIQELSVEQRKLQPNEVLLRVITNGICASDIHQMTADWAGNGVNLFNLTDKLIPGHEAISIVIGLGPEVNNLKIGDRVGCGPQRDSCGTCAFCSTGDDSYCLQIKKLYSAENNGGFAQYLICPEKFCFVIPESIDSIYAPLCCAGLTTFTPLKHFNGPKGSKVGVIGIGGLGLMSCQYAIAMGYEVTAFTTSKASKEQTLRDLGVHHVIDYKHENVQDYYNTYDYIINSVSVPIDTTVFLSLLKPRGQLVYVGLGNDKIEINPFKLVGAGRIVSGSNLGGRRDFKDMLEFSAKHKIFPIVEVVHVPFGQNNADKVAAACQRVVDGTVRYRMVMDYDVNVEEVIAQAKAAAAAQ